MRLFWIASPLLLSLLVTTAKANEVCKEIINGRKNDVTSKMCIVTAGPRIGDLLVKFYRDDDQKKKRIDVTDCMSKFSDSPGWGELIFRTGGLLIDYREGKTAEWYILTSGLTGAQRASWLNFSLDTCDFNVEDIGKKAAPDSGISGGSKCPPLEVMGPSGCESILKASPG